MTLLLNKKPCEVPNHSPAHSGVDGFIRYIGSS